LSGFNRTVDCFRIGLFDRRSRFEGENMGQQDLTNGGGTQTLPIAAAVTGPFVIKKSEGRLCRVLVTTLGTAALNFFDSSSAASGTLVGTIPASALAGTMFECLPLSPSRLWFGEFMTNLSEIVKQLKTERDRLEQQLSGLHAALGAFAGVYTDIAVPKPRRKISAKGRARIAAAQRARWAKVKGQKVVSIAKSSKAGKRTMSASARRKIAAAQRARWAKFKQGKKAA
jgi:hypothetical protein